MERRQKLSALEGLGYAGALMIAVGGLTNSEALRYFNVLGLVFAIIVIVRLMVMSIRQGELRDLSRGTGDLGLQDTEDDED